MLCILSYYNIIIRVYVNCISMHELVFVYLYSLLNVIAHETWYISYTLTFCPLGNFSCFFSSADFFSRSFITKILSRNPSECLTVWIQIRHDQKVGPVLGKSCLQMLSALVGKGLTLSPLVAYFVTCWPLQTFWNQNRLT